MMEFVQAALDSKVGEPVLTVLQNTSVQRSRVDGVVSYSSTASHRA
jgi:hypothetical protein